ncbi:hypothetical protein XENOCAPTIV_029926 [Xenoophorus captivus]|uniref:Uncharacterized protein n=1 Tax=Xenoophorus captivus TaxID=1517983 RepID=A0ABV0RJT9_9TELE
MTALPHIRGEMIQQIQLVSAVAYQSPVTDWLQARWCGRFEAPLINEHSNYYKWKQGEEDESKGQDFLGRNSTRPKVNKTFSKDLHPGETSTLSQASLLQSCATGRCHRVGDAFKPNLKIKSCQLVAQTAGFRVNQLSPDFSDDLKMPSRFGSLVKEACVLLDKFTSDNRCVDVFIEEASTSTDLQVLHKELRPFDAGDDACFN